jgi:hypothetical protein
VKRRASLPWGISALGLVIVLGLGAPALAADATGTWKWKVERNGNVFEPTLKLKQEKEKLTGTITGRQGNETEIEEGKVSGDTVSFKVTREFNGNKIIFTYEGKVADDTIKGEVTVDRNGETETLEWNAKREK